MINIYICEDNKKQLITYTNIVKKILPLYEAKEQLCVSTTHPAELLDNICKIHSYTGLYFLDIEFHDSYNGFQLAREIRKKDPRGYIVFITSHSEMSYMSFSYHIEAMDFILKDHPNEIAARISACMKCAWERECFFIRQQEKESITYTLAGSTRTIYIDELYRVCTAPNHRIELHTNAGFISLYGSLKDWEHKLLTYSFIRCSSSELININYIIAIDDTTETILLKNNVQITISRHYRKAINLLKKRL